jgi:hypothetical protein
MVGRYKEPTIEMSTRALRWCALGRATDMIAGCCWLLIRAG